MSLLKKEANWAAEKQSSEQMGKQLREGSGTGQLGLASQPSHRVVAGPWASKFTSNLNFCLSEIILTSQ